MNKKLIAIFTSCAMFAGSAFADEQPRVETQPPAIAAPVTSGFGYVSIGAGPMPIPLPVFGVGYRMQHGQNGLDLSLQGGSIGVVSAAKGAVLYHHYFKPNLNSQFYVGAGPAMGALFGVQNGFSDTTILFSPQVTLGKQYRNDSGDTRFFEAQINAPTFAQSGWGGWEYTAAPIVTMTYGIGF